MQDDDKNKMDDEIIDDADFDLGDFDDDDLADDESWDEFDDADTSDPKTMEAPTSDADAVAPKKKSFVQKNFNVIVIGVVALAGGGFFLTQMGSAPAPQQIATNDTSQFDDTASIADQPFEVPAMDEVAALPSGTNLPPMPTPIQGTSDTNQGLTALSEISDLNLGNDGMGDTLTPMPESTMDNSILSELSIDEVPTIPVSDEILEVAEQNILEFETVTENSMAEKELMVVESAMIKPKMMASEDHSEAQDAMNLESAQEFIDMPAVKDTSAMAETMVSSASPEQMHALEEKISNENNELNNKLNEANKKIETLVASISALEARLETLAIAPVQKTPEVMAPKVQAMSPPPKPAAKKPYNNQKVTSYKSKPTTKKTSSKTITKWILRAAQPGKALVASAGSNDMITVHIGDKLPGIGRISDITIENNKWVIRGSEGIISQ